MKKPVKVFVILLLLSISISSAYGADYFVSKSGNDGNGCQTALTACLTIQAAINKAGTGDNVNVAAGAYTEYIWLDKSVSLLGADKATTIITGVIDTDSVIRISSAGSETYPITIRGFTIDANNNQNGDTYFQHGIFLYNSNYVTVEENNIRHFKADGILISYNSNNNIIKSNTVTGSPQGCNAAVNILEGSGNNIIGGSAGEEGNTLTVYDSGIGNKYVVLLSGTNSEDNTIQYNTITDGERGIQIDGPPGNTGITSILDNTFSSQVNYGIAAINNGNLIISRNTLTNTVRPIEVYGPVNLEISDNTIHGSTYSGINLGSFSGTAAISGNTIHNIAGNNGIWAQTSGAGLTISDNIIYDISGSDGSGRGIQIDPSADGADIEENEIYQITGFAGIVIDTGATGVKIFKNNLHNNEQGIVVNEQISQFEENTIENNRWGIDLNKEGATFVLKNNNIAGNIINSEDSYGLGVWAGTANVESNWWGHYSGPGGIGAGSGDKILVNTGVSADYDPWLCDAYPSAWLTVDQKCDADEDTFAAEGYGGDDCNDGDINVNPGAAESCNGIDDDCDGTSDEEGAAGCGLFYYDHDVDTYGTSDAKCLCAGTGDYTSLTSDDCDDFNAAVNPGATETCNGIDDDCDESTDEDLTPPSQSCTVGVGACESSGNQYKTCEGVLGWSADYGACDATPGTPAEESCNGIDDDCDGTSDEEGAAGCGLFYYDHDVDTYGTSDAKCLCAGTGDYTSLTSDDCDDFDAAVNPGTAETCNGIDDDCDTDVDEGFTDTDSDGQADCVDDDDDGDGILDDAPDPFPLIPNRAPVSTIISPATNSWHNADFDVGTTDNDADGDDITCEYMVEANNGAWQTTVIWTARTCNAPIPISVNDCPYEGTGTCRVTIRATDEWGAVGVPGTAGTRTFSIDLSGPRISEINPKDGSYTGDEHPVIKARIEDRMSSVDSASIKMWVDSTEVTPDKSGSYVTYIPSTALTERVYTVKITASDMTGNNAQYEWEFTVDLTKPVPTINKPDLSAYSTRRMTVDVTVDETVRDLIGYKNGAKFYICRNCDKGIKTITFDEGTNTFDVEAVDYAGNTGTNSVEFFVDSKAPVIYRATPNNGETIHGSQFSVKYTEQNLKYVKLFWKAVGAGGYNTVNMICAPGTQKECFVTVDLSDHDGEKIQFYFEVSDGLQTARISERTISIDDSDPEVTVTVPENGKMYNSRTLTMDVKVDEPVTLEYSIDGGRFQRLCRNCKTYYGNKAFTEGAHTVMFRATDAAGNQGTAEKKFSVDSIKPKIYSTRPNSGYADGTFTVRYTESDIVKATLHYTGGKTEENLDCPDGNYQECTITIPDFDSYAKSTIGYYFTLVDIADNTASSRPVTLKVAH